MRQLIFLLALLLAAVTYVTAVGSVTPATVSDAFGNSADENSELSWADIPEGEAYETDPSYSYGGLKPLFDGIHSFVQSCMPKEIPYDILLGLIDGSTEFGGDTIKELVFWGLGYAICLVLGIFFFIIFPIVGSCMCCCRTCCGNCGGKMVFKPEPNKTCWTLVHVIGLLLCSVFLGCGMICTYVTNERMSTMISNISSNVETNVADFQKYATNTIDQIDYVASDGFNFTGKVMIRDLDNIGVLVGQNVQQKLEDTANVDSAFDQLFKLDPLLLSLVNDLTAVDTAKTAVTSSITALDTALSTLKTGIDQSFTDCGAPCSPAPDTSGLVVNFDPSTMPDFSTELGELQAVYATNITSLVLTGKQQYDDIENEVTTQAAPIVTSLTDMINSFGTNIDTALAGITDMLSLFDQITNMTAIFKDLPSTPVSGSLTVGDLEQYRWYGGTALTCLVLVILILQTIGLVLGCFGLFNDKDVPPTKRGCAGNCSGYLLMASVGFTFIFASLLIHLVWLPYAIGAPIEKIVCQNLRDDDFTIFSKLIDGGDPANGPYQTMLGEQTGYTLGQMALQDDSIPLTIGGLLTDCKNGETAWNTFHIENFFNMSTLTNYKDTIDVDTQIDSISVDLSTIELLPAATQTEIEDMRNSFTAIDFATLLSSLNATTVSFSTSALETALNDAATAANGAGLTAIEAEFTAHATELNRIKSNELNTVETSQSSMLSTIENLKNTSDHLPTRINSLLTTLTDTQANLQANGEQIIKNESKAYANRLLNVADQFVAFALDAIENDIGQCTPVWNFYESVFRNTVCSSVMDSFNAIWFSLGWCIAFMCASACFSVRLAKYVRRMNELHPDDLHPGDTARQLDDNLKGSTITTQYPTGAAGSYSAPPQGSKSQISNADIYPIPSNGEEPSSNSAPHDSVIYPTNVEKRETAPEPTVTEEVNSDHMGRDNTEHSNELKGGTDMSVESPTRNRSVASLASVASRKLSAALGQRSTSANSSNKVHPV